MRYKRIIPLVLFVLAAFLSAWISPSLGRDLSRTSSSEPLAAIARSSARQSNLPSGEVLNGNADQGSLLGVQFDPVQVDSIQVTISLLLAEDETQSFLPLVER